MTIKNILIGGVVVLVFALAIIFRQPAVDEMVGSVSQGSDYFATTTGGNLIPVPQQVLVTGPGALGSITITGANTGIINFYNATTTNVSKRTGTKPTSTLWLGSIPASTAAGTYVFDAYFSDGLLMELSGTEPTSTVMYRQY